MAEVTNKRSISDSMKESTEMLLRELSGIEQNFHKKVIDNIFSFVSVSGGAGATTIVANLATALTKKSLSVLVIDLNIAYPALHMYYGLDQMKKDDLVTLVSGESKLGESIQFGPSKKLSFLVPSNRFLVDKVMADNERCGSNLQALLEQAASLYDVILIDVPTDGNLDYELSNVALFKSDFIYVVFDENAKCVGAIPRFRKNLNSMGIPAQNMKFVMNKRSSIYYPKRFITQLELDVEAELPYDVSIIESALRGQIFIEKGSTTSNTAPIFNKGIYKLADTLLRNGGYVEHGPTKNDGNRG